MHVPYSNLLTMQMVWPPTDCISVLNNIQFFNFALIWIKHNPEVLCISPMVSCQLSRPTTRTSSEAIDETQTDLDAFLVNYSTKRPREGRKMNGKMPQRAFTVGETKKCPVIEIDQ